MKSSFCSLLLFLPLLFLFSLNLHAQSFTWAKSITSNDGDAVGFGISMDYYNDNKYITGYFSGTANFDSIQLTSFGGVSDHDIFIAKYDHTGKCLWAKQAGGASMDGGYGISFNGNGYIFVTGFFSGTAAFDTLHLTSYGGIDIFITMYDQNGNCIWAKNAGGINSDVSYGVSSDQNGNCFITGTFVGDASFDSINLISFDRVNSDIFIAKYDNKGNCLWADQAGGLNTDISHSIALDQNGNNCITGNFRGTAFFDTTQLKSYGTTGYDDVFIAKYDSNGIFLWAKQAGGAAHDYGEGIALDRNGNSYITGSFQDTASFGPFQLSSYGNNDIFIACYDPIGNCLWANHAGGIGSDEGYGIGVNDNGESYVTGAFSRTANFGSKQISSYGKEDIFVAKYSNNGGYIGVSQAGGVGSDEGFSIALPYNGVAYFTTGAFNGPADFDNIHLTGSGAFVSQIIFIYEAVKDESIIPYEYSLMQNYPNPFNPGTVISYSLPSSSNVLLTVFNTLGQKVKTLDNGFKYAGNYSINFNASDLPSGIYFYKLEAGQFSQVKKMILIK